MSDAGNRLNGFGVGAVKCRYGPSPRLSCYRPLGSSGGLMYFDLYHEPQNLLLPIKTKYMGYEQQPASHKPLLLSARFALTSSSPYKHSFLSIHTIARQQWGRLKFSRYNPYIHNKYITLIWKIINIMTLLSAHYFLLSDCSFNQSSQRSKYKYQSGVSTICPHT